MKIILITFLFLFSMNTFAGGMKIQALRDAINVILVGNVCPIGWERTDRSGRQGDGIDGRIADSGDLPLRIDSDGWDNRRRPIRASRSAGIGNADRAGGGYGSAREAGACRHRSNRAQACARCPNGVRARTLRLQRLPRKSGAKLRPSSCASV